LSAKFDCKVCPQNILHFEYKIWGNLYSKFVYKSLSADLSALLLATLSANFRDICPLFLLGSRVSDASLFGLIIYVIFPIFINKYCGTEGGGSKGNES